MIVEEFLNEGTLVKHYSDLEVLLFQNETGIMYAEPIDIVPCPYTYSETDEPIEPEETSEVEEPIEVEVDETETEGNNGLE